MAYPADLKYTKDHEWIRISGDSAEVGITDYAQQQLGDVVYVELPDVGRTVKAGESFGSIESVKAVSELFAPVSGRGRRGESALKDHPEAVNKQPHETWMVRFSLSDPTPPASLLDSAQYEAPRCSLRCTRSTQRTGLPAATSVRRRTSATRCSRRSALPRSTR